MKKSYIAPSIMLREVELADIIATSLFDQVGNGVQLAKPTFDWDDEDEDEDF